MLLRFFRSDTMLRSLLFVAAFGTCVFPVRAQIEGNVSPFRPLDLPTPTSVRTASGRPGPDYWQQRVDYRIRATLDPETHEIRASETVTVRNESPDPLPYLWLFVEQNMCTEESVTNTLRQPPLVFLGSVFDYSCQGHVGGMTLERVTVRGEDARYTVFGTTMRIDLGKPLAHGDMVNIEIAWHFVVPGYGMARMGRDGSLYEIAQWYPRMAVYDDVRGWNHEPYIGAGEFYLEYGDFDVLLTLPAEFLVAATGTLVNPDEVLTPAQRERLGQAMESEAPVAVITEDEARSWSNVRPASSGSLTWHFQASNVRDFAFAASPGLRWDATSWNGIRIETLYRPDATKWTEAIRMAREAIRFFSEQWYPYPYPHATTVEGPIEGMEYPMLTFVPDSPTREDLQWVLSHEFGHEWFPMLVGSNERLYPWMDEGFNTFIDLAGAARYFEGTEYGKTIEWNPLALYEANAVVGKEQPMGLPPAEQRNLFWAAYQKPALMMQLLRHEVLGTDRFDRAFRTYIGVWKNRHPTPADFFRIMRDETGMDLDWFWRGWIYTASRLDQAVAALSVTEEGESEMVLENRADMVMPVELLVEYENGSDETLRFPVEMWYQGPVFTYRFPRGRAVRRVTIDPRGRFPDADRSNNALTLSSGRRP